MKDGLESIGIQEGRFRVERALHTGSAAGGKMENVKGTRLGKLKLLKGSVSLRWKWICS